MKYYTIAFPGEYGQHVVETWSEDQIIKSYFRYWCMKMIEAGRGDQVSREQCIDDWIVVHWAVETDQYGKNILAGAEIHSDTGYQVASLEEALEFEKKRNANTSKV